MRAPPLPEAGRRGSRVARQAMFGLSSKTLFSSGSDGATLSTSKTEGDLDVEESRALEELSSILTTDDGLRLSGAEMREARSNWVRDLMSTGQSRVLTKVSSRLAVSVIIASLVAAVSNWSPKDSWWLEFFEVPGWPHELVGGFLAILLVFRTDQAYGRFWEGRTQWSTLGAELRSLARVTVANRQIVSRESLDEVLAHLSAFPVAFKQHLRGENDPAELRAIYEAFDVGSDGMRRILQADNAPLVIMTALSMLCNTMIRGDASTESISQSLWERSEDSLNTVSLVLSECEKIKCTPLPLSYSRHSSRFFTLFSFTLPFSLVHDTSPLLIAPVVVGISWILFATDEIGHVIEEPFGSGLAQEKVEFMKLPALSTETFNLFDRDKSGAVDADEFTAAMSKMGYYLSKDEAKEIVSKFDENGDQCISNEEWRQGLIDELERKADSQSADMAQGGLASGVGNILVMGINGFYDAVGMVFGIGMENYTQGVKQLEVLPLARYCRSIQRDILEQILFVSSGEERERYIAIARKLAAASDGDLEIIG